MPSKKCIHNKIGSYCTECKGISIWEHKRYRSRCKECKGGSICHHNKEKYKCRENSGKEENYVKYRGCFKANNLGLKVDEKEFERRVKFLIERIDFYMKNIPDKEEITVK